MSSPRANPGLPGVVKYRGRVSVLAAVVLMLTMLLTAAPFSALAAPNPGAFTTLDGAGADRDLGATVSRDYMTVSLNLTQQSFVRVSFTGYAFAKSSAGGTLTPGCPCLVRGELRANGDAKQIVTRTALSTDPDDIVADPAASPAVATADRRNFSGSTVYSLPAGDHTFVMSLAREVGTAQNVGFAFGRMQAEVLNAPATASPSPAPSATPAPPTATPAPPTPTPASPAPMPRMPNTGGGASSAMAAPFALGGAGFLAAAIVVVVALRRRTA